MLQKIALGRATFLGAKADCVFCKARENEHVFGTGDIVFVLGGPESGNWGRYSPNPMFPQREVLPIAFDSSRPSERTNVHGDRSLVAKLEHLCHVDWQPGLRLQYLADFEQYIVKFCSACFLGNAFFFSEEAAQLLVVEIWHHQLPVTGKDVAKAAVAHGMPSHFQDQLITAFEFGRGCLINAGKRKPVRNRLDHDDVMGKFNQALRYCYRWKNA